MSWTRPSHDACAYNVALKQSVGPLYYELDPIKYDNVNKCRNEIGLVGTPQVSHTRSNILNVENDLLGITRPYSKCPSFKHSPADFPFVQRKEMYKPITHPKLDLNPSMHLYPCQHHAYNAVPIPASMSSSSCYARVG